LTPPHSLDLTPVQNVNELLDRIIGAAHCVTNGLLANTWQETEYCLGVCRAASGAHTELY